MKILVVGGAGYLGGAVVDQLLLINNKYEILVYDNLLYEESYLKPDINFIFGDIRDHDKLKNVLKDIDVVIWLAAIVGDGACQINPLLSYEINTNSIKWLSENFDKKIIFISTCSVYGQHDKILDESSEVNPLSVYAKTKLEAESYLKNKDAIIFRLGTLFGLGDNFSRIRLDLVVNLLTVKACTQKKISIYGGNQFRPLLHVKDAAITIAKNIFSKHTGIFNLSYKNFKIIEIANYLKKIFPDLEIEIKDLPFSDARNYRVSSEKANKLLNFCPIYNLHDGILELANLVNSRRIKDFSNKRYSNESFLNENYDRLS